MNFDLNVKALMKKMNLNDNDADSINKYLLTNYFAENFKSKYVSCFSQFTETINIQGIFLTILKFKDYEAICIDLSKKFKVLSDYQIHKIVAYTLIFIAIDFLNCDMLGLDEYEDLFRLLYFVPKKIKSTFCCY